MTNLEYVVGINVLKQFYLMEELDGILKYSYDNNEFLVTWNLNIDLDKFLSEDYKIKKEIINSKTIYIIKDLKSLFYFWQTCRNCLYGLIDVLPIDALDYMIESSKKVLFSKSNFIISNQEWMNNIKSEDLYLSAIKQNRIDVISLLKQFDETVNPFINENFDSKMVENIFDIDVYSEENVDNCAHFTIKENNVIKKYCRHSKGFLYSLKIIAKDYILYIGHYFNIAKNGEVVSIIINIDNKDYKIKFNLTDNTVELFENLEQINDENIEFLNDIVSSSISLKQFDIQKIIKK